MKKNEKYLDFFELLHSDDDKISYNFKITSNDTVKLIVKDVKTGLTRDSCINECKKLYGGHYWLSPSPGRLKNLGPVDLLIYLNNEYCGEIRIDYDGGKELIINEKKFYMDYLHGNDYRTFWEIFIYNEYEKESSCIIKKGDVVLDIGANYGFFTLYSISKGASKIYSVEPYKPVFNHIEKLSTEFNIITPINKAVHTDDNIISMFIDDYDSSANCVTNHGHIFNRNSNEIFVEGININTLLSNISERINFMKIDCEGSEFELFKTITEKNLKSIDKIVVETHGEEINNFVYNKLFKNNFNVVKHDNIIFAKNLDF